MSDSDTPKLTQEDLAKAWDAGYEDGHQDGQDYAAWLDRDGGRCSDPPDPTPNPYRAEKR